MATMFEKLACIAIFASAVRLAVKGDVDGLERRLSQLQKTSALIAKSIDDALSACGVRDVSDGG